MKNGVLSNFTRSYSSSDRVRSGYEISYNYPKFVSCKSRLEKKPKIRGKGQVSKVGGYFWLFFKDCIRQVVNNGRLCSSHSQPLLGSSRNLPLSQGGHIAPGDQKTFVLRR